MPHLHLITGTGTAQRRLLASALDALASKGYEAVSRREGGDWRALLTENRGGGLFDDKSVILVDEAEKLGLMPENLAPLLEGEDAAVVILLACKSETPAIIPKELALKCSRSKAEEPSPWSKDRDDIVRAAAQKHGVSVSRDSIALIKELFEDAGELASEAEKLALYRSISGRREISRQDVETYCLSDGGKSTLKLLDGICAGRTAQTLASLGVLMTNAELLPTLSALHNRVRLAFYFAAFPREREMIAKALGARDYASRQATQAASLYGKAELLEFIVGLIRINANEKSGMGASWRDLNILVINLMSGVGADRR
jgi:DNA polymerase-3 subunit delta